MTFCKSVVELHFPQNICHPDRQAGVKKKDHFQDILRRVYEPKTGNRIFFKKTIPSSVYVEETKNHCDAEKYF